MEKVGDINRYRFEKCGHETVTVIRDAGVTPFLIPCQNPKGCDDLAKSAWYDVSQDLTPEIEWYRPTAKEIEAADQAIRDHVSLGGLLPRRIAEPKPPPERQWAIASDDACRCGSGKKFKYCCFGKSPR